jgi:dipeptidyl aminopeptidase/acylaminoacyl peptidase
LEQRPASLHDTTYEQYAERFEAEVRNELEDLERGFRGLGAPSEAERSEYERSRAELLALRPPPREPYETAFKSGRYECSRIVYASDGLRVTGYLYRPVSAAGQRHPVILYNRGGNRDFGLLTEAHLMRFLPFLDAGFVLVGSQYRGNDGGEGKEELGGADVRDVLHLVPLARSLPAAEPEDLFLYGRSRGGMMVVLALKEQIPVRAAAVVAAPADLEAGEARRPEMGRKVNAELIPQYGTHRVEQLRRRSAIHWAERINVPLLLLHGTADWRVDPADSLRLALRLQELGKPYGLVMYEGDDHALSRNRKDTARRVIQWFLEHRRVPPAPAEQQDS